MLVKSFALEMEEGNPASRRWIETRFLTSQAGRVVRLLLRLERRADRWHAGRGEGAGPRLYDPRAEVGEAPDGVRKQNWHYPSRTECMVCHSRAANFVLGLTELQMNKDHDYGRRARQPAAHAGAPGPLPRQLGRARSQDAMREELKAKGMTEKEINAYMHRQTATRGQREPVPSSLLALPPEKYRRLVDPYDPKADLTARARSYLHANCAQCHVEAGGGNAQMELEFTTQLDKMRIARRQAAASHVRAAGRAAGRAGPSGALGAAAPHGAPRGRPHAAAGHVAWWTSRRWRCCASGYGKCPPK